MSAMATGTPKCNDTIGLKMRNNRVARTARAAHILVKFLDEFCKTTQKKKTNKQVSTTTRTYNSKSFDPYFYLNTLEGIPLLTTSSMS